MRGLQQPTPFIAPPHSRAPAVCAPQLLRRKKTTLPTPGLTIWFASETKSQSLPQCSGYSVAVVSV